MDTKCLDEMLAEIEDQAGPLSELQEGLKDLLSLDLQAGSRAEVFALHERYKTRVVILGTLEQALSDARTVVETLLSDGHPVPPFSEVLQDVVDDLRQNLSGMEEALLRLSPVPLTTEGKLSVGPESKIGG